MRTNVFVVSGFALIGAAVAPAQAGTTTLRVRVENLAPQNGTFITPVWVGFHTGMFDIYDLGAAASSALERIAEDGDTLPLSSDFSASGFGSSQGVVSNGMPMAPGEVALMNFVLDNNNPSARYFSYASMVVPSNDAFIANGNPMAHEIFDAGGNFIGADFIVLGSSVLDAGTEVNDEVPMNTAFFGQTTPDTGDDENGVVHAHPGFMPPGSGGILDDPMFAGADFTAPGYQIARISITQAPAPGAAILFGAAGMFGHRCRRRLST